MDRRKRIASRDPLVMALRGLHAQLSELTASVQRTEGKLDALMKAITEEEDGPQVDLEGNEIPRFDTTTLHSGLG